MEFYQEMTNEEIERFEERLPGAPNAQGCHIWKGKVNTQNRGQYFLRGAWYVAARIIYSLHHKVEIPKRNEDGKLMVIAHKCHNPICVHVDDLVYITQQENIHMSHRDNRMPVGRRRVESKLTEPSVVRCRELYHLEGKSYIEIGKMYGVSSGTVHQAVQGKRAWKHVKELLNYRKIEPTEGTFKHVKTEDGTMYLEETIDG
jgi:hypothetical protein